MSDDKHPWLKTYPDNVEWDSTIPDRTMLNVMADTVRDYGDRPAMTFMDKTQSWAEIGNASDRFAKGLQSIGIKKGDKIGLFLPNCPYFLIAYYGILKAGATVVNYNPLYARRELRHQIEDSHTDLMVTLDLTLLYDKAKDMVADTRLKRLIICKFTDILAFPKNILFPVFKAKEQASIPNEDHIIHYDDLLDNNGQYDAPAIDAQNDVAVLQYTGGTTGVPKGAMLTHRNIFANTYQSTLWFPGLESGKLRKLGVLPFFHVFAMTTVMNFSVMKAMEIITMPRFELKDTLKLINKYQPHSFPAVPAIYNGINNAKNLEKYNLSSLRYCISGGAPLPVEVKKTFEKLTGCVVVEGYGLSESSPVAVANPVTGENRAGSIGLPVPGTIVEIINHEDKTTPMPIGKRGELCIRGPQVMKGYWNKEQATAETLIDGRLHTGDIAIMDEDGYISIVDRIKDMIITNGYNVYPRNIEEVIYLRKEVEECIVAGLPDEQRGEIVKAWIKLKDGQHLSEKKLRKFLKENLSPMEVPKKIEYRTQPLPKTMIGKLSRKDIVAEELGEKV